VFFSFFHGYFISLNRHALFGIETPTGELHPFQGERRENIHHPPDKKGLEGGDHSMVADMSNDIERMVHLTVEDDEPS